MARPCSVSPEQVLLRDLTLERDAAGTVSCHGLHPWKTRPSGQSTQPIRPPKGAHSRSWELLDADWHPSALSTRCGPPDVLLRRCSDPQGGFEPKAIRTGERVEEMPLRITAESQDRASNQNQRGLNRHTSTTSISCVSLEDTKPRIAAITIVRPAGSRGGKMRRSRSPPLPDRPQLLRQAAVGKTDVTALDKWLSDTRSCGVRVCTVLRW